ncbi:clavesin-1-like [Leguminivora glycinivorella]|uniref:clavesin-1-like n=1 Tax=Leguminivora glycinivorella TaxID=1035111 RepID=UPI0020107859|nr:clavesin-1-like [Leguminivora glycinivorella]
MFKMFLEIAFEAELDTTEHPELAEMAREICQEHPETRASAVQELRDMIYERGECSPRRTDDEFLLRFLRQHRFVVRRAHRQLVRYCTFLEQYPELYRGVDLWGLARLGPAYEVCILDRPGVGRISILRFGAWDPDEHPGIFLVQVAFAMTEIWLRLPKLQVLGGTLIVDLENITMKHVAALTPTIAYQIVCLVGLALPCAPNSIHIINYNWLFHTFFFLFKRFIPKKAWKRIHFHRHDLQSLRDIIDPECLPIRYGGTCRHHATIGHWFNKIRQYRDEAFDREMKEYGWLIKE